MTLRITTAGAEAEILLVEDNPGDVRLVTELFSEAGIENPIHVATSGREALDFVHQRGEFADRSLPDIVLLDWHLPRISGESILRTLNDDPDLSRLCVIVLTGTRVERESLVPSDLTVDGYLTKPVDPDEFCSRIRSIEEFSLETCS